MCPQSAKNSFSSASTGELLSPWQSTWETHLVGVATDAAQQSWQRMHYLSQKKAAAAHAGAFPLQDCLGPCRMQIKAMLDLPDSMRRDAAVMLSLSAVDTPNKHCENKWDIRHAASCCQ